KYATGYEIARQTAVDTTAIQKERQKSSHVVGSRSALRPSTENAEIASAAVGSTRKTTSHAVGGRSSERNPPFIEAAPARPPAATRRWSSRPPGRARARRRWHPRRGAFDSPP